MQMGFFGREQEMAELAECVAEALEGHPQFVICEGEAGIGKSRLAEELARRAEPHEFLAVWGTPVDDAGAPPYWPWVQVLRALANQLDLAAVAVQERLGADLGGLVPELGSSATSGPVTEPSPADRFRQFDAVARLLGRVSRQTPLLIVLDDAHWADEASLLLLHHLSRGATDERLLVVANVRDTEARDDDLLTRVAREPLARRIRLRGLPEPAMRQQLASVLGRQVDEREGLEIHRLTGGNPFFSSEVALAMADERRAGGSPPVTRNLHDAIGSRLRRLSPDCVRVLQAAAIVGREFSVADVAAMVDQPVALCLALLDEASADRFVEPEDQPGGYRFVHALVRDAIEYGIGTPDRVRLHRLAAEAIERQYRPSSGPRLFDLARHWEVAAVGGERSRAAEWLQRAANEAMRLLAYEEAARLFRQSLAVGGPELDDEERAILLLAAGTASHLSADLAGRLDACLEAADVARALDRPDLLAEAALVMEGAGRPGFDLATRRLCEEAIAGLAPQPSSLRARVTARLAESFAYLREVDRAKKASDEALAMAESSADPIAVAAALRASQLVRSGPDGLEDRSRLAERMLELSRQTRRADIEQWGRLWRIDAWFEQGDLGAVATEIDALARCVREIQGRRERFEVLRCQAALAQAQARFVEAQRRADEAFALMAPTGHPSPFAVRAAIANLVGRHIGQDDGSLTANELIGSSEEIHESFGLIGLLSLAHALVTAGRTDEAAGTYRSLGPVTSWGPLPHIELLSYAFGIAVADRLGVSADVQALHDRLNPRRGHHVVSGAGAVGYLGPVELWLGIAARHLGWLDAAVADLEQAESICRDNGAEGFRVETLVELAAVLAERDAPGDRDRSRSLAAGAASQAAAMGMEPYIERAAQLAAGPRRGTRHGLRLTRRELEVARLVGLGLTNRQIAERLVVSPRTAQNHVQHILTKLGVANRSQVALWVNDRKDEHAG